METQRLVVLWSQVSSSKGGPVAADLCISRGDHPPATALPGCTPCAAAPFSVCKPVALTAPRPVPGCSQVFRGPSAFGLRAQLAWLRICWSILPCSALVAILLQSWLSCYASLRSLRGIAKRLQSPANLSRTASRLLFSVCSVSACVV